MGAKERKRTARKYHFKQGSGSHKCRHRYIVPTCDTDDTTCDTDTNIKYPMFLTRCYAIVLPSVCAVTRHQGRHNFISLN